MTAARRLSISGGVREAVAKRRGGRTWQAHLLPQRLGRGVEVNDLRALDEGGGEQLLFRQWQMSETGTGLVSRDSKVLGALCEEPKTSICQGSCGDSGRMAGSQLCGLCGSPWLSGQASPAWQPGKL